MRKYQEEKTHACNFLHVSHTKVGMNAKISIFQKFKVHECMAFSRHNISTHLLSLDRIT
jgi:hypothetical protein